jgi:hypothetical protein
MKPQICLKCFGDIQDVLFRIDKYPAIRIELLLSGFVEKSEINPIHFLIEAGKNYIYSQGIHYYYFFQQTLSSR